MKTDVQVLALLRKRLAGSKAASDEFALAKRDDLQAKQDAEIAVMEEYAARVETYADEDISKAIEKTYHDLKGTVSLNPGVILKELLRPGGTLDGKAVEKAKVARMVSAMLKYKT